MTKHRLAAAFAIVMLSVSVPASAAVVVITQAKALAGDVTPGDTPGFPVTLSRPGAYRLDTDLTVPAGRNGIHLISARVSIDMNGFSLYGWNAAGDIRLGNHGVYSSFGVGNLHDGVITGFKFDGLALVGDATAYWTVRNMRIVGNGGSGVDAADSDFSQYVGNTVADNEGSGIRCGLSCHVEGNNVSGNGFDGVYALSGSVLGNTIVDNASLGIGTDLGPPPDVGYGNNTLLRNNPGANQVFGVTPMQPNFCFPAC